MTYQELQMDIFREWRDLMRQRPDHLDVAYDIKPATTEEIEVAMSRFEERFGERFGEYAHLVDYMTKEEIEVVMSRIGMGPVRELCLTTTTHCWQKEGF